MTHRHLSLPPLVQVRTACEKYGRADPPCAYALALLVDILQAAQGADTAEATALCTRLQSLDPIRARYWKWRSLNLSPAAAAAPAAADAS